MLSAEALKAIKYMKESKELRKIKTLEEMRERQKKNRTIALPDDAVKEIYTVGPVEVEKISLCGSDSQSALVYIHGGGFKNGFASNGYWISTQIARITGQTVYAMNYRLAPEFTYPTATDDCVAVWKDMIENRGIKAGKSAFLGTSAGGTLALSVALWCRDHSIPLPSSIIANSPFVRNGIVPTQYEIDEDVILNYPESPSEYYQTASDDDPYAYPLLGNYTGFPPVAIFVAEKEILHQHSILLDRRLTEQNVEHTFTDDKELWHAFLNSPVPENVKYAEEIATFIMKNMKLGGKER